MHTRSVSKPFTNPPCCFPRSVAMQLHDTIEHAESRAWNSQDSYTATGEHQGLLQAPPPPPHHAGWQSRSSSRAGCTR